MVLKKLEQVLPVVTFSSLSNHQSNVADFAEHVAQRVTRGLRGMEKTVSLGISVELNRVEDFRGYKRLVFNLEYPPDLPEKSLKDIVEGYLNQNSFPSNIVFQFRYRRLSNDDDRS